MLASKIILDSLFQIVYFKNLLWYRKKDLTEKTILYSYSSQFPQ